MEDLFAVFISKLKERMDKCIRLREEGCGLLRQSSEILGRASVQDNPTGQIVSRFEEKKKNDKPNVRCLRGHSIQPF